MPLETSPIGIDTVDPAAGWAAVVRDGSGNLVPQIYQEQTEWCWAACAQMVLQFYGNFTVGQCDLASQMFGESCCGNPSAPLCNKPSQVPTLANIYTPYGHSAVLIQNYVPFETLQSEINANRPVEIGLNWGNETGHQLLVCGWDIDSLGQRLLVNDPLQGTGPVYYVNLLRAYGWGYWQYTWQSIT
jgi:Papain-like cysteine protease AvrRpt2